MFAISGFHGTGGQPGDVLAAIRLCTGEDADVEWLSSMLVFARRPHRPRPRQPSAPRLLGSLPKRPRRLLGRTADGRPRV